MSLSHFVRGGVAIAAVCTLAACSADTVTAPRADGDQFLSLDDRQQLSRHIFVLTEEDVASEELLAEIERRDGVIEKEFDFGVLTVAGLTDEDASILAGRRDVVGIDRDLTVQWVPGFDEAAVETIEGPDTETDQSGAFFYAQGMQWNISQVDADDAWTQSGQGAGQVVAVLDTGGDPFHIDLVGKYTATSASALSPGSSPCGPLDELTIFDLNFHGTFVAGIVTTNGLGAASTAPDASIMAVKVLNCSGRGSFGDIIAGIVHATDSGADVINMSLGAYFPASAPGASFLIDALQLAVNYAHHHGVYVIAAAGNDGINLDEDGDFIHVPSQLINAASIGATAPINQMNFDMLASYSNFGITGMDYVAPGGDLVEGGVCSFAIFTCDLVISPLTSFLAPGNNWYVASAGTSFASPMVAGAAAVVASSGAPLGRTPDDHDYAWALHECILLGADDINHPGPDVLSGFGRLNVLGSVGCTHPD